MQKTRAAQLGTRIRFLCTSHATEVPTVTMHEQQWAYCPGGEPDGHKWFKTGGITRAALDKFEWPDEEEAEP